MINSPVMIRYIILLLFIQTQKTFNNSTIRQLKLLISKKCHFNTSNKKKCLSVFYSIHAMFYFIVRRKYLEKELELLLQFATGLYFTFNNCHMSF